MKRRLLITAGPTREMLDPVRYLSNRSTGEMGYALAEAARIRGYQVTLISGPTALPRPNGVRFIPVVSARDLREASEKQFQQNDALIMVAAVCDFTAASYHEKKIKRARTHALHLKKTPDILKGLAARKEGRRVIGFCLETEDWLINARRKLERKNLDGIVANFCSARSVPFGKTKVQTALLDHTGRTEKLRAMTKRQLAGKILSWMESLEGKNSFHKVEK